MRRPYPEWSLLPLVPVRECSTDLSAAIPQTLGTLLMVELRSFSRLLQEDRVRTRIDVFQSDLDQFLTRGGKVLSNVIWTDWQLAMAAVKQHGQLNPGGPTEGTDRIHRGTARATGE